MNIFYRDFFYKIEGDFSFLANLFFLVQFIFKGISCVNLTLSPKVNSKEKKLKGISLLKLKAILVFWWTFFLVRFIFKGISFLKLKANSQISIFLCLVFIFKEISFVKMKSVSFFWWKLRKVKSKGISFKRDFLSWSPE